MAEVKELAHGFVGMLMNAVLILPVLLGARYLIAQLSIDEKKVPGTIFSCKRSGFVSLAANFV